MAGPKRSQASLDSFFKTAQPVRVPCPSSSTAVQAPASQRTHSDIGSSKTAVSSSTSRPVASAAIQPSKQQEYTSHLPPAPGCDSPSSLESPAKQLARSNAVSSNPSSGKIVRSSDDEDSDSDSSLVDLTTLLQSNRPDTLSNASTNKVIPSTPSASRFVRRNEINSSPIVVPKYKFDLKYLASLAKSDDAIEASSKRVKALSAPRQESDAIFPQGAALHEPKSTHLELLGSVVAEREDGEMQRVTRAIKRTEATLSEHHWYFFHTRAMSAIEKKSPFPTDCVPETWRKELLDPQSRYQTIVSGFAEDMVSYGKTLPDEIFLWILNELCREPSEPLRVSFSNILRESPEQVHRLVGPDVIQNLFRRLGANPTGISISDKIRPIQGLVDPYSKCEWGKLCAVVKFLSQVTRPLQQNAKVYTLCMLLRMSIDRVVLSNLDVLDLVQEAINHLCRNTPAEAWEACCHEICRSLFESVDQATLRLQIVECVPSLSPRTHDLRRRLAMTFYFNDISYSLRHSHHLMNLNLFITRLEDPTFDLTPDADYRELTALVSLLDIAVDDARSTGLDLTDKEQERRFDKDIDDLAATIKDLMKGIGNPGAAFISKIEAKEALELVAQRIADTLRSKPKPKDTVFDGPRLKEDLEAERAGIQSFLSKMKKQTKA